MIPKGSFSTGPELSDASFYRVTLFYSITLGIVHWLQATFFLTCNLQPARFFLQVCKGCFRRVYHDVDVFNAVGVAQKGGFEGAGGPVDAAL